MNKVYMDMAVRMFRAKIANAAHIAVDQHGATCNAVAESLKVMNAVGFNANDFLDIAMRGTFKGKPIPQHYEVQS